MKKVKDLALKYTKAIAAAAATAVTPLILEFVAELSKTVTASITVILATLVVALSPKNKETPSE
jgi:hypothetical protein